jgi:hypothetical protein
LEDIDDSPNIGNEDKDAPEAVTTVVHIKTPVNEPVAAGVDAASYDLHKLRSVLAHGAGHPGVAALIANKYFIAYNADRGQSL